MVNALLIESFAGVRVVTLNRPALLNALSLVMLTQLFSLYQEWERQDEISCIVLKGMGPKAFCAGGDIRALTANKDRTAGEHYAEQFFRMEYSTDYLISKLTKPHLAILDGVSMGGGVGLSLHGSHRLATDQTILAMPEVRIGLFPDVGSGYELSRLPDNIGVWLSLTGACLSGADSYALGLATHYLPSIELPALMTSLSNGEPLAAILPETQPAMLSFERERAAMRHHFSFDSMESIVASLQKDHSIFAQECVADLAKGCPLSQKITLEHLKRCKTLSLKECFLQDFRLIMHMVGEANFQQGVTTVLTKQPPIWQPERLEEISDEVVEAYFEPGENELDL